MEAADAAPAPDEVLQRVLDLPPPLARRIAASAEVLNLLDSCCLFPVDCRLVAQAVRSASLLGRVQRETARAAPLFVLVDIAALQRRPSALLACLRWLLGLPNVRVVRFADGGKGSMLKPDELSLLLQLAAVHPQAAASLQHLGTGTMEFEQQFDAGVLAPLTRLRSLRLRWFCTADLAGLTPSVRSVELQLPGAQSIGRMLAAALSGTPLGAVFQRLLVEHRKLSYTNPLAAGPSHVLRELVIDADDCSLLLDASQLFGIAAAVQLLRAAHLRFLLPLSDDFLQPCKDLLGNALQVVRGDVQLSLQLPAAPASIA
ncbi:Zn-dependent hydrolase [Chlorella sorokiniana]|uniref:Zn-dependent hydrolase n=1 Tax=Chlorella sorokiniana TaxID=3076 RepID=A0A2P6TIF4_CHLSO|nr:Zn-dependent hydrolase [Chlorella sorokiniana]|eukprot:PRW34072.1 Zn-dependent hydrolase [Chlorella sorokiniana]